ncbi:MAG: DUF2442 domain-containing protein [Oscillospiraceae bacterium]|nr:DUF2442 domain-containing protein [Oscillospiraceae bacterium]
MAKEYFPVVVQAVAGPERTVYAYFSDGKVTKYDMAPAIARGGVFTPLADEAFFSDKLTVMNDTVAWDLSGCYDPCNCIDIDPFEVYSAASIADPQAETA